MRWLLKIFLLFFLLILHVDCLHSQVPALRDGNGNILNLHQLKITPVIDEINFEGLDPNINKLKYSDIKGSPFWSEEEMPAILYAGEKIHATVRARNNLVTGQLHFSNNQKEFVITNQIINKVVFIKGEDSIVFIKHPEIVLKKKFLTSFVQVMNTGRCQLLKYIKRTIVEDDSLFGTRKRYSFKDNIYYFLKNDEKVEAIKKLDQENLLTLMPYARLHHEWAIANRINFRKEEDVVFFLKNYNSKLAQPK